MKLKISMFLLIELSSISILAQAPDTQWTRTYGGSDSDLGWSAQQTSDNGFIIVGRTHSFDIDSGDVWLIKTDNNGDILWTKTFGGFGWDDGKSVQQTSDEGYIITGNTNSFSLGDYDIWLIKTKVNGDTLWTRTYGGSSNDKGRYIQQTSDGGYIIVGSTSSFGAGSDDLWLIKTDNTGDTLWTKTYGGIESDFGNCVQQTPDSGYLATGTTSNPPELWVLRTDAYGDTLWTKTYGDNYLSTGTSLDQTSDGGFIVSGYIYSLGHNDDFWLLKMNTDGDTLWTKRFGGIGIERSQSVMETCDGGFIMCGRTASFGAGYYDIWLVRTDANGNILWTKTYGGNDVDEGNSAQQTLDGGYIIIGYTASFGAGLGDVWLIKVASDVTAIDEKPEIGINAYRLQQNYPNPFNPTTRMRYAMGSRQFVSLKVYDILGKEIAVLVNEEKHAGNYEVEFDGSNLTSGIYFYRLQAGQFVDVKKMILMK